MLLSKLYHFSDIRVTNNGVLLQEYLRYLYIIAADLANVYS